MIRPYVLFHAHGWFSVITSWNRLSVLDLLFLSGVDNLLVPVDAFNIVLFIICRLVGLSSDYFLFSAAHRGGNPFAEACQMVP